MTDKPTIEKWEMFINAKGPQLEQMSTQQLYAEVRVNAANAKPAEASSFSSNEVRVLTTTEFKQAIQALKTRIDSSQRNNGLTSGRGNGRGRSTRSRLPNHPNKYCEKHGNRGHNTEECLMLKRRACAAAGNQ